MGAEGSVEVDRYTFGSYPKATNQKDVLTLGIASKGNLSDENKLIQNQFIFFNTEDKNNVLKYLLFSSDDFITTYRLYDGTYSQVLPSHNYAWKFGIINYTDNDIELDIASYKKDLTDTLDKLIKETNGKVDGDALIEFKPDYEIKQILPTTKEIVTGNSFKYSGMNIKLSGNGESGIYGSRYHHSLIENFKNDDTRKYVWSRIIYTSGDYNILPSIFKIDLGKEINNICQISFSPFDNRISRSVPLSSSVKNYSLYVSSDDKKWTLIKESIFEIEGHKLINNFLFSPEDVIIQNIMPIRYIKIIISSIYGNEANNNNYSGFGHFRIYTNTKNLYNKEVDQSISNYKDNTFNQATTRPEWDQKSKEDKIILNKQASFDNPPISKIKNELNDFRVITNHNNIPIYEKT